MTDYNLAWQIFLGLILFVGAFLAIRFQTSQNAKDQAKFDVKFNEHLKGIYKRLDKHGDDIVRMNSDSKMYMTSKEADDVYLRRKEFEQFEKHIDNRFDQLSQGQGKILDFISNIKTKNDSGVKTL